MDSNATNNNINEILFKYNEGDLSSEELDRLLSETESELDLAFELEKWEQTKITEELPLTTELEEKILAKTIYKSNFNKSKLYSGIILLLGISVYLLWPSDKGTESPKISNPKMSTKNTVISTEVNSTLKEDNVAKKQLFKSTNSIELKPNSNKEIELEKEVPSNHHVPNFHHVDQPISHEEFAEENVKSNSDSILSDIPNHHVTKQDSTLNESPQKKKKKKKIWLMPSNNVLPINRDF
jgi:hypothetical protein